MLDEEAKATPIALPRPLLAPVTTRSVFCIACCWIDRAAGVAGVPGVVAGGGGVAGYRYMHAVCASTGTGTDLAHQSESSPESTEPGTH